MSIYVCMSHNAEEQVSKPYVLCSDWTSRSRVVLPRNSAGLRGGGSQERLKDVRPQELHRVPNHTQRKYPVAFENCQVFFFLIVIEPIRSLDTG